MRLELQVAIKIFMHFVPNVVGEPDLLHPLDFSDWKALPPGTPKEEVREKHYRALREVCKPFTVGHCSIIAYHSASKRSWNCFGLVSKGSRTVFANSLELVL